MAKKRRNPHRGSTLDSFLEQEGTLAEFQAQAIKEVIAWQLAEAMKDRKLTKTPAGRINAYQPDANQPDARPQ